MNISSSNPVAIITGASRGIGQAITETLATLGYDLVLIAQNEQPLVALKQALSKSYPKQTIVSHSVDVANEESVRQVVNDTIKVFKRMDVLVNNAGICHSGTADLNTDALKRMIDVNLLSMHYFIQAALPQMKQQKSGYIFNISSMSGKRGTKGLGGYSLTKFGMVGYGEALMKELVDYHIKVTAICPGLVHTDMTKDSSMPITDKIQPADIANVVRCCLSLSEGATIPEVMVRCWGNLTL